MQVGDRRSPVIGLALGAVAVSLALHLVLGPHRSDVASLYRLRGIRPAHPPYIDRFLEYPPVVGIAVWGLSFVARSPTANLVAYAAGAVALVAASERSLRRVGVEPGRLARSPQVLLYAVHNFDLLAVAPAVGAIAAFEADLPLWSGVLAGIGTWAKLYPVAIAAVALGLLLLRGDRVRAAVFTAGYGAASIVLNGPFLARSRSGWWATFSFHVVRLPTWGSLWFYVVDADTRRQVAAPGSAAVRVTNAGATLALAASAVAIAVWMIRRRPDIRRASLAAVIAFMVCNKVYSPQYDLWLVPLMLMVGLPRRYLSALGAIDAVIFVDVFLVPHAAQLESTRTFVMFLAVAARAVLLFATVRWCCRRAVSAPVVLAT